MTAYTNAFHLRPGVQIESSTEFGTLTVAGDLDLSNFRYASLNPNSQQTGVYGSGEPGALVIRAGGNLDVAGSISDGFMPAPATSDDNGWLIQAGDQTSSIESLLPTASGLVLNSGTTFPNTSDLSLRYAIPITGGTIAANAVIPTQVTLSSGYTVPAGTFVTLAAAVYTSSGTVLYPAGTVLAANTVIPAGSQLAAGSVMPGAVNIAAITWPAGANLGVFTSAVTLASNVTVPFEGIIPAGTNVQMDNQTAPLRPTGANGSQGSIFAVAAMLPTGDQSWSIRLVAGADLGAADTAIVKPASLLKSVGVSGNLTLMDAHSSYTAGSTSSVTQKKYQYTYLYYGYPYTVQVYFKTARCVEYGCTTVYITQTTYHPGSFGRADPSVIRTGTGNLDLIAGGSFSEQSLYGVYTAGTQSPDIPAAYNAPLGLLSTGLPTPDATKAAVDEANYQAWYPENGGNVLVSAQGAVSGYIGLVGGYPVDTDLTSNWLVRQGGRGVTSDPTAWSINFGIYAETNSFNKDSSFIGFQGIGTLGGGNLTVIAGGNAGVSNSTNGFSNGLDLAVASTGRVLANGTLVQTGGGALNLTVGGVLNPLSPLMAGNNSDYFGSITDLRGNITINAGAVGEIAQVTQQAFFTSLDPRTLPYGIYKTDIVTPGPVVTIGDGTVSVDTRGNLVFGGAGDAGMEPGLNQAGISYNLINPNGSTTFVSGQGVSSFSLWTPTTAISPVHGGGRCQSASRFSATRRDVERLHRLLPRDAQRHRCQRRSSLPRAQ